jgi:hypothetical protein
MLWFVNQSGKTEGPIPEQRVEQLIVWGKISRRAYICDEQLSRWVSIKCSAFARLFAPLAPLSNPAEANGVRLLGALRGGPWRRSTGAAQRLGGLLAMVSVCAGALQLASGLAQSGAGRKLAAPTHSAGAHPPPAPPSVPSRP